jgi:hypothetical protein
MRENRTSGLMSGVGKRGDALRQCSRPTSTLPHLQTWRGHSCLDSAGINRHGVANERVVQGREGAANHLAPSHARAAVRMHLKRWTGVSVGWVLSSEIVWCREPTASDSKEGYNVTHDNASAARPCGVEMRFQVLAPRPQVCRETPCARTGRPHCRPRAVRCGPEGERDER